MGHKGNIDLAKEHDATAVDRYLHEAGLRAVRELAREYTEAAIDELAFIMQDRKGATPNARRAAAEVLLAYGVGKPSQIVYNANPEDHSVTINILKLSDGTTTRLDTLDPVQIELG